MSANSVAKGLRGYVISRSFGGFSIPVPLQSLALRDYCQRKDFLYILPANENCFPHSYMILESVIQDLTEFAGIILYSVRMLPLQKNRRLSIYSQILKQKRSMHLVLEDMVLESEEAVSAIEELFLYERLSLDNDSSNLFTKFI